MHNPNSRLEAFCDGVFAIAITLLIIEIKIPPIENIHTKIELWDALAHSWPSWLAFFISFITILISWVNHSHALKSFGKTSPQFTYANGLLLMAIIILPFPTMAIAEYLQTDIAQPAITLYCAASLLNNIAWNIIQYTYTHPQSLFKPSVNIEKIRAGIMTTRMGFGLYLFAFLLSFWFPLTAFIIVASSWGIWLILSISIKEENITA
ncbi:TMEM175 family protein [Chryseobacterium limigenitum]|uniref:Uncharacterized membrane protein n=1 Tax=Chryseobacterium limigenitum TaxID=1612149 RepID=A0A1K2IUC1_9FLAO|nr:TMEM175 family protein [Chryseobacterium limigenitum]SFZ95959.1 Uncharacterized membrane protein [Chryseobacterium limigenitum]